LDVFKNTNVVVKKKQGDLGVARAIYEYTKMGYTVLAPLSDSDKYDLVVDTGDGFLKVQVKTSRCKPTQKGQSGWLVNLATRGGNTTTNTIRCREVADYDILFVLVDTGDCWSIPTIALGDAKYSIKLGTTSGIKYAAYKL
jgi:hypothetical protein